MGRTARLEQAARAKARERRIAMERDRAVRDAQIEEAAARVFTAIGGRNDAQAGVVAAENEIGAGLEALVAQGLTATGAAELCELTPAEAHRLLKRRRAPGTSPTGESGSAAGQAAGTGSSLPPPAGAA